MRVRGGYSDLCSVCVYMIIPALELPIIPAVSTILIWQTSFGP